jgi:hypothetical protein
MIIGTVLEFLHDPNFGIGEDAVAFLLADALHWPILIILVYLQSIVDIESLGLNPASADHFHLLGFAIVESCGVLKGVEKASVAIDGTFGKWDATATMTSADVESGVLDIKIQAASVNTGSGMKDGKLKAKTFLMPSTIR